MSQSSIKLHLNKDDPSVAYVELPDHPTDLSGRIISTVRLADVLPHKGADIFIELDEKRRVIGMEIFTEPAVFFLTGKAKPKHFPTLLWRCYNTIRSLTA